MTKRITSNAHTWANTIVHWVENGVAYISVVFTWQLPKVYSLSTWYKQQGYDVLVGGPAVNLMPDYLPSDIRRGEHWSVLARHNRYATFTSRGCIRRCSFCAVPKIEGDLVELDDWEPKPIVCDNNILACSSQHFGFVVDRLKGVRNIDFNQGLDARLLDSHHLDRFKELHLLLMRFAWDDTKSESYVFSAIEAAIKSGFPKWRIRCYVLFNFRDTPDDALYRCETLKRHGILVNPQRYQPLDCLTKNSYVAPTWDRNLLGDFTHYWSRQVWLMHVPFEEYRQRIRLKQRNSELQGRLLRQQEG